MRNRPAVTVGMPFRNPGPFLEYAVRSLFAQTFDDWELVLIDDGSTDESVKLAAGIDDARVRLIRDGRALGLVPRLNQVIDLSRGRYIARMDADDMIHPHRLSAQLEFLEKNTGTDVVDSGAVILDAERNPVGVRGLERPSIPDVTDALKWGVVIHASVLARRDWYIRHRYDPGYPRAEDRELFIRALRSTAIAHIPEPLYFMLYARSVRRREFVQSYRSERKVLFRYGPELVGWPTTARLWLRSHAKSVALDVLLHLRGDSVITRRAFQPISPALEEEVAAIISRIERQPVPGWQQRY